MASNYRIERVEVPYGVDWIARWFGSKNPLIKPLCVVHRHADRCVTIEVEKKFFYGGEEFNTLYEMLGMVLAEDKACMDALDAKEAVRDHTDNVDIGRQDAMEILRTAQLEIRPSRGRFGGDRVWIFYNGEWMDVSRTDLTDDVCTHSVQTLDANDLEEIRKSLVRGCRYGVRIKDFNKSGGGRSFAIVDSFSDG